MVRCNRGCHKTVQNIYILERIKTLKEHIIEKHKEVRCKRKNRAAQEIRETVDNGGKIWEVKRRLEKKVETRYSIAMKVKG